MQPVQLMPLVNPSTVELYRRGGCFRQRHLGLALATPPRHISVTGEYQKAK